MVSGVVSRQLFFRCIGRKQIHDLNGGDTLVFTVNHRSPEHIAGDGIKHIFLLFAYLLDISGQHGYAAHEILLQFLGHEIPMKVIGVENGQFFRFPMRFSF